MELAIRNPQPEQAPAASGVWLPVSSAAQILAVSLRQAQRMCQVGELLARKVDGEWEVDAGCRPSLRLAAGLMPDAPLHVVGGEPQDVELAGLSESKRQALYIRYGILRSWMDAAAARGQVGLVEFRDAWVELHNHTHQDRPISARSLYRWEVEFRNHGLAGLIDSRRNTNGASACSPDAWALFMHIYLQQSRPCVSECYDKVAVLAESEGWDWPSLRTIQNWAQQRIDRRHKILGTDPKRFRDRCLPTADRDWTQVPAMACWVADHRQLDVLWPRREWNARKQGWEWKWRRPWVTMFLDARSWMPVAWTLCFDSPNGNRVMATFAKGVQAHGRPQVVYLDNGKDFRMVRFSGGRRMPSVPGSKILREDEQVKGLLQTLGVQAIFAIPYNARAKVIEPWFRLMSRSFDVTWPTYCGRNDQVRPEGLKTIAKKQETFLAGRISQEDLVAVALADNPQDVRDRLALAPLERALNTWITGDYAARRCPASACGDLSVSDAFTGLRGDEFREVRPAPQQLALLLMPSVPVRVEPQGVYVRQFGGYYNNRECAELDARRCGSGRDMRRKVSYRFSPDDPGKVYLFDAQGGAFLCVATPYHGTGTHPLAAILGTAAQGDQVGEVMAEQRLVARDTAECLRTVHQHGGNLLLRLSATAAEAEGRKLDHGQTSLVNRVHATPVLQLADPALAQAAAAGARVAEEQQDQKRQWQSAREFFAGTSQHAATGTDDLADGPREVANPFKYLKDGASTRGTDAHEDTPPCQPPTPSNC